MIVFEKKDLKYVRQSMYSERRKLHPAQPKNQAEFHSILDDIGAVHQLSSSCFSSLKAIKEWVLFI
jgi:hypothetical protein